MIEGWSASTPADEAVLRFLHANGTLALAEQLMDEDAAGIERQCITVAEFEDWLDRFWSAR